MLTAIAEVSAAGGGPHQSRRPHCEKSCASKERDENVPSGSYSGPTERTFPGFAVHKKTLPAELRAMPVICADPALASCAKWLARGKGRENLLCLQVCLGKSAQETPLGGVYLPDLHQRPLKSGCPATADGEIMQVG